MTTSPPGLHAGAPAVHAVRRRTAALLVTALLASLLALIAAPAGADGNEAPGAPAAARSLSVGNSHNCVILDNGGAKCWGFGSFGQLGQGSAVNLGDDPGEMSALASINLGTGRTATAVSAGENHTCALLDNGTVKCWGGGGASLGLGNTTTYGDGPGEMGDNLPAVDLGTGRTATAITAGHDFTCALLDNGTVKCWGRNTAGELGQGNTTTLGDGPGEMGDNLPAVDLGTGRTATAITAGHDFTCALLDNGTVKCWGRNTAGELGQGNTTTLGDGPGEMGDNLPAVNLGTGRTATAVSAGTANTCALLDNGAVKCWGSGGDYRLGQDTLTTLGDGPGEMGDYLPGINLGTGRTARAIGAGDRHNCALLDNGTVKCWGANGLGQLGQGTRQLYYMADIQPIVLGRTVGVGATARPDGHLRRGSGAFSGLNTYNTTGAGQTVAGTVAARGSTSFTVRVENDGTYTDRFRVKAPGSTSRYTVTYRRGSTNITSAVTGAGFVTPDIRPGQHLDLTLTIQATPSAARGARIDHLVTITSQADSTRKDAVKARVTRS